MIKLDIKTYYSDLTNLTDIGGRKKPPKAKQRGPCITAIPRAGMVAEDTRGIRLNDYGKDMTKFRLWAVLSHFYTKWMPGIARPQKVAVAALYEANI